MEEALILETSFVIDLERERRAMLRGSAKGVRGQKGAAHQFLAAHPSAQLHITVTTAGELAAGVHAGERARWESLIQPFAMLTLNTDVCWQYSRAFRYLADQGRLIGTNDLWIAATAIAHELPLVTRDTEHFGRVPGLRVMSYGE